MSKNTVIQYHEDESAETTNVSEARSNEEMVKWINKNHDAIIHRTITFDDYKKECLKRRIPYYPEDLFIEAFNLDYHSL